MIIGGYIQLYLCILYTFTYLASDGTEELIYGHTANREAMLCSSIVWLRSLCAH